MRLILSPGAVAMLAKLRAHEAAGLVAKLEAFAAAPTEPHPFAKAFGGGKGRIRQGDWRALYRIDPKAGAVVVEAILNRKDAYR